MDSTLTATTASTSTSTVAPPPRAAARLPWRRLVVLGDSVASGVGDPVPGYPDRPWAAALRDALDDRGGPPGYRNLGVPGARIAEVRAGQLGPALAFGPDLAVLACGGNDALRRSFDPEAVGAHLAAMAGALAEQGALVVTFGMFDIGRTGFLPPDRAPGLSARLRALGDVTAAVTRRAGGVHVDLLDHPEAGPHIFGADRLHPNRRGHALVARETVGALAAHAGLAPR
jgi:lysophospholipase L1-like esterase